MKSEVAFSCKTLLSRGATKKHSPPSTPRSPRKYEKIEKEFSANSASRR
jgi:hypothetical protein